MPNSAATSMPRNSATRRGQRRMGKLLRCQVSTPHTSTMPDHEAAHEHGPARERRGARAPRHEEPQHHARHARKLERGARDAPQDAGRQGRHRRRAGGCASHHECEATRIRPGAIPGGSGGVTAWPRRHAAPQQPGRDCAGAVHASRSTCAPGTFVYSIGQPECRKGCDEGPVLRRGRVVHADSPRSRPAPHGPHVTRRAASRAGSRAYQPMVSRPKARANQP